MASPTPCPTPFDLLTFLTDWYYDDDAQALAMFFDHDVTAFDLLGQCLTFTDRDGRVWFVADIQQIDATTLAVYASETPGGIELAPDTVKGGHWNVANGFAGVSFAPRTFAGPFTGVLYHTNPADSFAARLGGESHAKEPGIVL